MGILPALRKVKRQPIDFFGEKNEITPLQNDDEINDQMTPLATAAANARAAGPCPNLLRGRSPLSGSGPAWEHADTPLRT